IRELTGRQPRALFHDESARPRQHSAEAAEPRAREAEEEIAYADFHAERITRRHDRAFRCSQHRCQQRAVMATVSASLRGDADASAVLQLGLDSGALEEI